MAITSKLYTLLLTSCIVLLLSNKAESVHLTLEDGNFTNEGFEEGFKLYRKIAKRYTKPSYPSQFEKAPTNKKDDGRRRVFKTEKWPYCFQGCIKADSYEIGSGVLVGPRHVLTAGHVVYDDKEGKWEKELKFIPAYNGKEESPFGSAKAVKIHTFDEWRYDGTKAYDLALIILDRPIGDEVGWAGMKAYTYPTRKALEAVLKERELTITGYPADKEGMQTMTGFPKTIESNFVIHYDIHTAEGQSGSGLLNKDDYVIGIHTGGVKYNKKKKEIIDNRGVLLTEEKFDTIVKWIEKNWEYAPEHIEYSRKNYRKLLKNLENNFSDKEICIMAGYQSRDYKQNFQNMKNFTSEVLKKKRWDFLIKNLKKEGYFIRDFL